MGTFVGYSLLPRMGFAHTMKLSLYWGITISWKGHFPCGPRHYFMESSTALFHVGDVTYLLDVHCLFQHYIYCILL